VSAKFELVKGYYDGGQWDIGRVWKAVGKWITAEEYKQITGKKYKEAGVNA
jgi:hypothetical protein